MPAIDPTGPFAALALALTILTGFVTGKILARNTVPREDFVALQTVNASLVAAIPPLTEAVKGLTATVERIAPKNGTH